MDYCSNVSQYRNGSIFRIVTSHNNKISFRISVKNMDPIFVDLKPCSIGRVFRRFGGN
jgi:hypothetical protein